MTRRETNVYRSTSRPGSHRTGYRPLRYCWLMSTALLFVALFPMWFVALIHVFLRRTVGELSRFDPPAWSEIAIPPAAQVPVVAALEATGHELEHSAPLSIALRRQHLCLLRHVGGEVIAEVTSKGSGAKRRVHVCLTSVIEDRLVSTQTTQGLINGRRECKQVFRGADVAILCSEHARLLDEFRRRGGEPRLFARGSTLADWASIIRTATQGHPVGLAATLRAAAIGLGRTEDAGSAIDRC